MNEYQLFVNECEKRGASRREFVWALQSRLTDYGFIYYALKTELEYSGYGYHLEVEPALNELGIGKRQLELDQALNHILNAVCWELTNRGDYY